ncbi:hypothetical protein 65p332 [Aeromonas phage 65]|uniref:Uncharacterized protein n=2 Tax=Ishigurovirus osborne TaxID=260149 RepID=A0A219YCG6_9CAUD|nr:hypothetical protein ST65p332 [Aeromonas phage 65]ADQ53340.1 hypothetical protein 65p332 [Aeromonas phage 65]APU01701.1 hypothetical protein [Aeromonas phage 65.2]
MQHFIVGIVLGALIGWASTMYYIETESLNESLRIMNQISIAKE